MQIIKIAIMILMAGYLICLLIFAIRTKRPVSALVISAVVGIAALIMVNLTSEFTGFHIAVNPWTVGTSVAFSLMGVLSLVLVRLFF
ncbi:MAG: pro-sigmaK processing inhibitor BofA family protein [Oscillospiraceae bacterium]